MHKLVRILSAIATFCCCQMTSVAANAQDASAPIKLDFSFEWGDTISCSDDKSPVFTITNVPSGTTMIHFKMIDLDYPSGNHGMGDTVKYELGQTVFPKASLAIGTYRGPCPPRGAHTYQWTATAYGATKDVILGVGKASRNFPR